MSEVVTGLANVVDLFERDAPALERARAVPAEHFGALAGLGLYGAFAPLGDGGLGLGLSDLGEVVEVLAAACLTSTFVWIQHFRLLAAVLDPQASAALKDRSLDVVRGEIKGGVALGGQLPGPPRLRTTATSTGWVLDGDAPWVSGWGMVDDLVVAARDPEDTVVSFLVPARERGGLVATRHELAALNASATVRLDFRALTLGNDDVIGDAPYDPTRESAEGLRINGSLALGVVRRCCALLGSTSLDEELASCRRALDGANGDTMAKARANACALALRASHALAVQRGSSSVLEGDLAERTAREATLLLTFGSRPAIRRALLEHFGALEET